MSKRGWNANLPTRWLTDPTMMDLTACESATHSRALMFGVEHETDGLISTKALRLIVPYDCAADEVVAGLVESGIWQVIEAGFQIVDWAETQTTKADAERTRKQNRERQRRFQAERKADDTSDDTNAGTNALLTQPPDIRPNQHRQDEHELTRENAKPAPVGPYVPQYDADGYEVYNG